MLAAAEVDAHPGDVGHAQRPRGGAAQVGREPAGPLQKQVVDERRQVDGATVSGQVIHRILYHADGRLARPDQRL